MATKLRKVEYFPAFYLIKEKLLVDYKTYLGSPAPLSLNADEAPGAWIGLSSTGDPILCSGDTIPSLAKDGGLIVDKDVATKNLDYPSLIRYFSDNCTPALIAPSVGLEGYKAVTVREVADVAYALPSADLSCPLRVKVYTRLHYSINDTDPAESWITMTSSSPQEVLLNSLNDYPVSVGDSEKLYLERPDMSITTFNGAGLENSGGIALLMSKLSTTIFGWGLTTNSAKSLLLPAYGRGGKFVLTFDDPGLIGTPGLELPVNNSNMASSLVTTYGAEPTAISFSNSGATSVYSDYYPHCHWAVQAEHRPVGGKAIDLLRYSGSKVDISFVVKECQSVLDGGRPIYGDMQIFADTDLSMDDATEVVLTNPKKLYTWYGLLRDRTHFRALLSGDVSGVSISCTAELEAGNNYYVYSSGAWSSQSIASTVTVDVSEESLSPQGQGLEIVCFALNVLSAIRDLNIRGAALIPIKVTATITPVAPATPYDEDLMYYLLIGAENVSSISNASMTSESAQNPGYVTQASFTLETLIPISCLSGDKELDQDLLFNRMQIFGDAAHNRPVFELAKRFEKPSDNSMKVVEQYKLSLPFNKLVGSNKSLSVTVPSDGESPTSHSIVAFTYTYNPLSVSISERNYYPYNIDSSVGNVSSIRQETASIAQDK